MLIRPLGRPGDLGWVVQAHGELYAAEHNWDASFEALVAKIVGDYAADHDDTREAAWIAELDGERVGCVFCMREDDTTAKLRVLLVHPKARGHGAGNQLVDTCVKFARDAGYERMVLWTVDGLTSARKIYEAHGFELIEKTPQHSFGHDVIGQLWARPLQAS
ncbi:GNAT family N-acetyltransferase [Lentzea flava]|uniref:MarR family transcriptional regulator n=1 Tax=Lentzea flava TaxID=103732 RepID=A0ABQ2UIR8_9PSEU|nr:GNAT family N-acetyltransferase [Lentzea flava]MCP2199121.1 Acetyltransferase (GNAT) family protein [Lentzea flava]GGU34351.1 MarR family transcriptional regulator [Lentzea flava]